MDLDRTEDGSIVGQLAIVGKAKAGDGITPIEEGGGGCNAAYGSATLFFAGLMFFAMNMKNK